ncbi:MAG TPA: hypothetical protein VJZ25_04175, partial [Gemmatimonadaceae bacterium]|nr:hypothetical protein [Gemmatimonadaceae bacterium]
GQETSIEDDMKPGWQHTKEAITTDQKNLTDDPRIHEEEKQELKSNDRDEGLIPKPAEKFVPGEKPSHS